MIPFAIINILIQSHSIAFPSRLIISIVMCCGKCNTIINGGKDILRYKYPSFYTGFGLQAVRRFATQGLALILIFKFLGSVNKNLDFFLAQGLATIGLALVFVLALELSTMYLELVCISGFTVVNQWFALHTH